MTQTKVAHIEYLLYNRNDSFALHRIGKNTPSPLAIAENANVLARLVNVVIIIIVKIQI